VFISERLVSVSCQCSWFSDQVRI